MAQRVNLDAMIQREDLAREIGDESAPEIIRELKIGDLLQDAPIRRLLRKPDFQRETNHWKPDQVLRLLTSFIDGDVIPAIILWRSTNYVFVIDGAHRLSALCAWISDDYGEGPISKSFYGGEIAKEQQRIGERMRSTVNRQIGSFAALNSLVGKRAEGDASRRAGGMFIRPIYLQQVVGTAKVAEDSFFAINTQGTPLDDTETLLIKARQKPVAIGARAIIRSGTGHAYWSSFSQKNQQKVVVLAADLHQIIFEPQITRPLKTLNVPHGGPSSPVDALAVLIDFLTVANSTSATKFDEPMSYPDDDTGDKTIEVLESGLKIASRVTGNSPQSLGLHPAVYFMTEQGKHSRFLFLGMTATIAEKLRNNDGGWFLKFTTARKAIEAFLIEHKSLIGVILQNLAKPARTPKMRDMFNFMVTTANAGQEITPQALITHLALSARIYDVIAPSRSVAFTDDTKSTIFYREAIKREHHCPICGGLLDITKSVSYDHVTPRRESGLGTVENGQMVHPYCNTAVKN
jgi:hypothetical protein